MTTTESDQAQLSKLMKGIRFAMLTTVDPRGDLVARPMTVQDTEFDGDLWFLAARDSTAIAELDLNKRAGITMTSNDAWISLSGTASMVDDTPKVKELWNQWVEAWFPEGPDDPNVVLIKFSGESAEYWDTPGGRIASVVSLVKAKVTGETYSGGDNATVDL